MLSYPVHGTEVYSFSEVETLVEAAVVSSGKSDDKLASALIGPIDLVKSRLGKREPVHYWLYRFQFPCFSPELCKDTD